MEVHYVDHIDPATLNGNRHVYEATSKAAPLVIVEAYRMAKAYSTPLVFWHNERVVYVDPHKYSLDDVRNGRWKDDPSIYDKPILPDYPPLPQ